MRTAGRVVGILLHVVALPLAAQDGAVVSVQSAAGARVRGALVTLTRGARSVRTDDLGEVRFSKLLFPDTIHVIHIGFLPAQLVVDHQVERIEIVLQPQPPLLTEIQVTGEQSIQAASSAAWVLPTQIVREFPAAVEPDVLRSLALVPSVSFSSPLSARPILRGYDASETVVRLDGLELRNPYHIARAFSGIPAEATTEIAVSPVVVSAADGGTASGIVAIQGREASSEIGQRGGLAISPGSAAIWFGSSNLAPVFLSARTGLLETITAAAGEQSPYRFVDAYVHSRIGGTQSLEVTGYISRDAIGRPTSTEWSNTLLGIRRRFSSGPRHSFDAHVSATRFSFFGADEDRSQIASSLSTTSRIGAGVATTRLLGSAAIASGVELDIYHVRSELLLSDSARPTISANRLPVVQAFLSATHSMGRLKVEIGARLDATRFAALVQPRLRLSRQIKPGLTALFYYARAGRLFQSLTDPQAEPTFTFIDVWQESGKDSTPVPAVHHMGASLDWIRSRLHLSATLYGSRGYGLGELRPVDDEEGLVGGIRFGDSRTLGLESRISVHGSGRTRPSAALIYVLSSSERRWHDRWVPWQLDRRHVLRLQLSAAPRSWSLSFAAEAISGQPLQLVRQVIRLEPPPAGSSSPPAQGQPAYLYAPEGSARSAGTLRMDAQVARSFGGPGASRISVALSVVNAGFGPVSPQEAIPVRELFGGEADRSRGVPYRRRFDLPAIPSILVRVTF